jgi:hypothetical protein
MTGPFDPTSDPVPDPSRDPREPGHADLERLVHDELRQLPLPRAPHTLLPRVMEAVEAASRGAWYSRAWLTWPWWWQIASIGVVALLGYGVWRLPVAVPAAPPAVTAAAGTTRVIWDVLIQPLLPYLAAVMVLMVVACVVFGAALNYVLLERVEQRR